MYIHTFFSHAKHAHSVREAGGNGITGVKGVQDIEEQIEREIIFPFLFFSFFFLISFRFSCAFGFNQDNGIGRVNGWMVVWSCFGRRSVAVGGPR